MMNIRKAVLSDSETIAGYLLLAMEEIIYTFIDSENREMAKEFMLHFLVQEGNQYSYQHCWVAEIDDQILGTAIVYNGAELEGLRQPVLDYIRKHYNNNFQPEAETRAGEYYIDCLAVDPNQQGKGVGSKILQFLIHEYVIRQHQTLGLLVDEDNPDAKRLYLKLGFKNAGKRSLFGKQMEHLIFTEGVNERT